MKYCVQCGQELADEARFCTKCGAVSQTAAETLSSNSVSDIPPTDTAADSATQFLEETPVEIVAETVLETGAETPPTIPPEPAPAPSDQEAAESEMAAGYQPAEPAAGVFPTATAVVVPPSPPRKRWPFVLGGILVLLLLGGWALYSFGNFGPPQTLQLAPQDTAYYICVKPNLLQAWNAKQLKKAYLAAPETRQAIDKIMNEWKRDTDTDFEQDFQPWIGKEIAVIMPDIGEEDFIAAIESSNDARAQASLDKLDKGQSSEENYHGVRVKYNQADGSAYAIADGFVLASNDVDLLKSTIDRKLGSPASSLADNEAYQKMESSLPWNRSAIAYFNMNAMADEIAREAGDLGGLGDVLEAYQAAGASVSITKDGIRSDGVVVFRDGASIPKYFNERDSEAQEFKAAMQMIPANSICFMRSSYMVNLIQDSYRQFKEIEPGIDESIGAMEGLFGINMENDVINPLRGDITLAVTPKNGDAFFGDSSVPVGGLMLMGVKDQAKIENVVDTFSDLASDGGAWVDHRQIGGGSAYYFGDSYSEQLFTLALKNNLLMIASSPELTNIVLEQQGGNLENNSSYQAAFKGLPDWNRVMYIDIQGMSNVLENTLSYSERQGYEDYARPLLYPIKTMSGVQSTDTGKGVLCSAMFIKIGN